MFYSIFGKVAHVRQNLSKEKLPEVKHLGIGDKVSCTYILLNHINFEFGPRVETHFSYWRCRICRVPLGGQADAQRARGHRCRQFFHWTVGT